MKTVFRRHFKWLPLSPTMQRAISLNEQANTGTPQDLEPLVLEASDVDQAAGPIGFVDAIGEQQAREGGPNGP